MAANYQRTYMFRRATTVKMLSVMLDKGLVKRDEKASPHIYRPVLSRQKTGKRMLGIGWCHELSPDVQSHGAQQA